MAFLVAFVLPPSDVSNSEPRHLAAALQWCSLVLALKFSPLPEWLMSCCLEQAAAVAGLLPKAKDSFKAVQSRMLDVSSKGFWVFCPKKVVISSNSTVISSAVHSVSFSLFITFLLLLSRLLPSSDPALEIHKAISWPFVHLAES